MSNKEARRVGIAIQGSRLFHSKVNGVSEGVQEQGFVYTSKHTI